MATEFKNEPFVDFGLKENRQAMETALKEVRSELGKEYPLIIGNERLMADKKFQSYNPSTKELVGVLQQPSTKEVEHAIEVASKAFKDWSQRSAEERAGYLFKSVSIMRRGKFRLSAWLVHEVGKSWAEADGDVAEAIDFIEFYAREALRYAEPQPLTPIKGEVNELKYIPLGVGIVIPPWNFPMSILTGMTSASIVTGNTVVLKPSSDSPVTGAKFMEIMEQAGLPTGVINFLPGRGSVIGDTLVGHPLTRFVAFTGSKEVGLHINELAARPQAGQIWIKRIIVEMGGKDCIVVDEDADLEDAASGVVASAFGYQGQKCSACSRVIVLEPIYDEFIDIIVEKTKKLKIGNPENPANYMGPVINERAFKSILSYIEMGKNEGKLLWGGNPIPGNGYFIEPTIIADVSPGARIAQEEIFGPVLAVIKASNFDKAIEIANSTLYGLTGSLYTKNRSHIEIAKNKFHCGNLYFNRKCTGAFVGAHPFGGFNMSGTDSKAGGSDYLLLFTQAKVMAERIGE